MPTGETAVAELSWEVEASMAEVYTVICVACEEAPVFTAFDHPNDQKLISQHISDVLTMPPTVFTAFRQGAFVVSIFLYLNSLV